MPGESARASGATIATPSVVLWIAKPMTRKAPSASEPTAYAEPIATPSRDSGLEAAVDRGQRQVRERRSEEEQLDTAEGAAGPLPDLDPLQAPVNDEETQQPDRDRHEQAHPVIRDPAQHRHEQHSEDHRDHAHALPAQALVQAGRVGIGADRQRRVRH